MTSSPPGLCLFSLPQKGRPLPDRSLSPIDPGTLPTGLLSFTGSLPSASSTQTSARKRSLLFGPFVSIRGFKTQSAGLRTDIFFTHLRAIRFSTRCFKRICFE